MKMSLVDLIEFPVLGDKRGSLIALEAMKNIPFDIKRVYYIFGADQNTPRGLHAHKELQQVAICVAGRCRMILDDGYTKEEVWLDSPEKAVSIGNLWHEMHDFSHDCVLLVLASNHYDESDYIRDYEEFSKRVKVQLCDYDKSILDKSWKWFSDENFRKLTMTPKFSHTQQMEFYNSLSSRKDYHIFGIKYDNVVIGACGLKNFVSNTAELWIYIGDVEYQSRKLGPIIMELLENYARSLQLATLRLKVWDQNVRAINLYKSRFFIEIEKNENVVVMELDL